MTQSNWIKADSYYEDLFVKQSDDLKAVIDNSNKEKLLPIAVSPNQGKFLYMLVLMQKAERILEIGTLGGYSALWMAKALPENGKLITLEKDKNFAQIARNNFISATDVSDKIEIIEGDALDTLSELIDKKIEPFDFIFIDADKRDNLFYFERCLQLSKKGTVIIADNVIREGAILNTNPDPVIDGLKDMNLRIASEPRVTACMVQTVGVKGYDGFSMIMVTD